MSEFPMSKEVVMDYDDIGKELLDGWAIKIMVF